LIDHAVRRDFNAGSIFLASDSKLRVGVSWASAAGGCGGDKRIVVDGNRHRSTSYFKSSINVIPSVSWRRYVSGCYRSEKRAARWPNIEIEPIGVNAIEKPILALATVAAMHAADERLIVRFRCQLDPEWECPVGRSNLQAAVGSAGEIFAACGGKGSRIANLASAGRDGVIVRQVVSAVAVNPRAAGFFKLPAWFQANQKRHRLSPCVDFPGLNFRLRGFRNEPPAELHGRFPRHSQRASADRQCDKFSLATGAHIEVFCRNTLGEMNERPAASIPQ
jgi:hypothetical protein